MLKSWAVPKGPSLNPADKRLAVETEDHPLEYIDFEGVIPEGEYGGGPMIVWDTGTWAPMDDVEKSLATGAFKFRLAGEKLNGGWMLARLKPQGRARRKTNWLLFKEHDPAADARLDILADAPGEREDRAAASRSWSQPPKPRAEAGERKLKPGALPGAVQGRAAGAHRAAARDARRRTPPDGRRLAARDQVRRLPHHGASSRTARCG